MNTTHNLKLIDGKFDPNTAAMLLNDLINSKINFHKTELFKNKEQFGADLLLSEQRITALKTLQIELKSIIEHAMIGEYKIQLNATINMEFVK